MNTATFQARQVLLADIGEFPTACAWSSDGAKLAFGTAAGMVHVFDTLQSKRSHAWQAHEAAILQLRWHPLETLLSSSAQDGKVRHWIFGEHGEGLLHAMLQPGKGWVENLEWRPDGRYLALSVGKNVHVYSRDGKRVNETHFPNSTVAALAWSPRGTDLAVGGHQYLQLLSGTAGTLQKRSLQTQATLLNLRWSPDGRVLASCCHDTSAHFWRVKENRTACMSGFQAKPRALAWSPDSRFLVLGGGERMTAWEFDEAGPEGRDPVELGFHEATVTTMAIDNRSGHLAAGGKDRLVSLWHAATAAAPYYHFSMGAAVEHVLWGGAGKRLLAAADRSGQIGIWNTGE